MFKSLDRFKNSTFILFAGCGLLLLGFGIRHSFGIFLLPISKSNGWGREVFAGAIASQNLLWGIMQPFAGRISDRIGSGFVVLVGAILYSLGLFLMASLSTKLGFFIAASIVGIGMAGVTFPVFGTISRSVAAEKRSLAIGIAMSFASIGQFVMLPISLVLIQKFGAILAFTILSALSLLMLIFSFPLFEKKITKDNSPDLSLKKILVQAIQHKGY